MRTTSEGWWVPQTKLRGVPMEILLPVTIAIGLLLALDLAAIRFGADTRDH
jgi:hypothetical protein